MGISVQQLQETDISRQFNKLGKEFSRASNENAASWHPEFETLSREPRAVPDSWTMECVR